jgi:hypothetical protein
MSTAKRQNIAGSKKFFSLGSIVVCMTFGADKKEYMSKSFLL